MSSLVWFRIDLRLTDNPALHAAMEHGGPIIPVFIYAPDEEAPWQPGGASKWWLHQSLEKLQSSLHDIGSRLIIREGPTLETLRAFIKETGADTVFWNRRYEPAIISRDAEIKKALRSDGLKVESFNAALFNEPWTIQNQSGKPFQVFTPFWKHCLMDLEPAAPLPKPKSLPAPKKWPKSAELAELSLEPRIKWADGIAAAWQPGEEGAHACLKQFLSSAFTDYTLKRNHPDVTGTSRLSPFLHFGEISPRQIWHAVRLHAESHNNKTWRSTQFITEIGWREFSHHLLYHFPHTPEKPLRRDFENFPWRKNTAALKAWQKGQTGYPIVDAGMRELWTTGWMHNRVRMIVASFLIKDLLLPWQAGARWFWDTLVDADLAQNTLGWQWTAGCGADAAPYFRIFNPTSQGEKFDSEGHYVRRWCPELAKLPDKWIHCPWEAPLEVLQNAGVRPGQNYPKPIVDHAVARNEALEAFSQIRPIRMA
jgi:deoxyribodipyrimidine photo-lyase